VAELLGSDARERILQVRRGLRELASMLARAPGTDAEEFSLKVERVPKPPAKIAKAKKKR
jgi:hypothetical protein